MTKGFKPLSDRVLVKAKSIETRTESGILIPGSGQKKPSEGEVISVGANVEDLSIGDNIMFAEGAGTPITIEGTEYLIIKVELIYGIL